MNAQTMADLATAKAAHVRPSEEITSTTVLIADGTSLPESVVLKTDFYRDGWSLIRTADSADLNSVMQKAGWHFFYLASRIQATVFGFSKTATIRRAMKRLIGHVVSGQYNCFQVEDIRTGSLFGFPFVTVSARPRHIQQSFVLAPRARRHSGVVRTCSYV